MRFDRAKLKQLREKAGMTQHELASLMNIREHTIYAWEYGRRTPSIKSIGMLARFLGVEYMEMLTEGEEDA